MAQWYADHLGISLTPTDYGQEPWGQEAGPTVFEPFAKDTQYFPGTWMINFRVQNLDAMMAQLRTAGIAVEIEGEDVVGRFAKLQDPEGNGIQLWEPVGAE